MCIRTTCSPARVCKLHHGENLLAHLLQCSHTPARRARFEAGGLQGLESAFLQVPSAAAGLGTHFENHSCIVLSHRQSAFPCGLSGCNPGNAWPRALRCYFPTKPCYLPHIYHLCLFMSEDSVHCSYCGQSVCTDGTLPSDTGNNTDLSASTKPPHGLSDLPQFTWQCCSCSVV